MTLFGFAFSYFVLGVSYMMMAIYLLWKNPRKPLHIYGALLGVALAGWALCSIGTITAKEETTALFWTKLFITFIIFVPFLNLLFIRRFLSDLFNVRFKRRLMVFSGFLSVLFLTSNMTPLLIKGVSLRPGNFYFKDPGVLYHLFELCFFFVIVYCSWGLLKGLQLSPKGSIQERQCLTLLLTLIVSYLSGSTSYLLAHNQVHFSVVSIGNYGAIPYSIGVITAVRLSTTNRSR